MLNWIVNVTKQYLKPFNGVPIKLLALDRNTWNYLLLCPKKRALASLKTLLTNYLNHIFNIYKYKQD